MTQELARKVLAELEAMGCSPEELELHRQELFAQFRAAVERENDRCGDPDDFLINEGEFADNIDFTGAVRGKYAERYKEGVSIHVTNEEPPEGHTPEEWEALCQKWDEELAWVQAVESAEPPEETTDE